MEVLLSARRLRAYFQSFKVEIKIYLLLKKILQRPDLARRMVGWAIEFAEYELEYESRGPIKAHVLADFIT